MSDIGGDIGDEIGNHLHDGLLILTMRNVVDIWQDFYS